VINIHFFIQVSFYKSEQIAPEAVKQAIEKIDQAIKDKEVDKKVKQKINYAKKNGQLKPGYNLQISTTMLSKIAFIVRWGKK